MHEESKSVVVALPAEALWDYLSDYDNVVRLGWEEASARRIRASLTCKVRYRVMTVWQGVRNIYTACLEQPNRPRTLTWSTREGLAKSWVRFDLEPLDATSTRVEATLHFEMGAARSAEPLAWELLRPSFVMTLSRLEELR